MVSQEFMEVMELENKFLNKQLESIRKRKAEIKNYLPKPKYKTFKDYYDSSEEFRTHHKQYMLQKVQCPICSKTTARCNMSKHQNTNKCRQKAFENKIIIEYLKRQGIIE